MSSVWLLLRGDAAVSASKLEAKSLGTCWIKSDTLTRDNVIIIKITHKLMYTLKIPSIPSICRDAYVRYRSPIYPIGAGFYIDVGFGWSQNILCRQQAHPKYIHRGTGKPAWA